MANKRKSGKVLESVGNATKDAAVVLVLSSHCLRMRMDVDFSEFFFLRHSAAAAVPFILERRGHFFRILVYLDNNKHLTNSFFFRLTVFQWLRVDVEMTLQKMSYWRTINSMMHSHFQRFSQATKKSEKNQLQKEVVLVGWWRDTAPHCATRYRAMPRPNPSQQKSLINSSWKGWM